MDIYKTDIDELLVFSPNVFSDSRGSFFESFNQNDFNSGLNSNSTINTISFVQDNHSISKEGVLRGLHYQSKHAQGKLVRVIKGIAFDVVVDIRKNSKTFGKYFGIELSQYNFKQLWIPAGFAHGFLALSEEVEFLYKTTDYRYAEYERCIIWNDPDLNINWPLDKLPNNKAPILSDKDKNGLPFSQVEAFDE
ncbi:MAG: RmlC: dTDP-4-dehydrorhamnose 3,5-epimerase [Pseudomonadota bacterium]|jgi:dTDP-4-dehydrorhamnose 3,5-epimerase